MLTVIAARRCMYVRMCVLIIKDVCVYMCMYVAYAHGNGCEAMHVCMCMSTWARCMLTVISARWCMHVLLCVSWWTRRMVTVIAARRCMRVLECVSGLVQGAWSPWLLWGYICVCGSACCAYAQGACSLCLLRGDACMCWSVFLGLYKVFSLISMRYVCCGVYAHHHCCKTMHVCSRACECVSVSGQVVCWVCLLSLLGLKHQDASLDRLVLDSFNIFMLQLNWQQLRQQ